MYAIRSYYAKGQKLNSPTKTGYTFNGWYDNPSFTGSVIEEIGTTETGVITSYSIHYTKLYDIKRKNGYI